MRTIRKLALLGVLTLLTGLVLVAPTASAGGGQVYDIRIGARLPGIGTAESMRFFPSSIRIHQNDRLHFTTNRFHTATLLPVGESAQDWIDANATPLDQPLSHFQSDPDDGAGHIKENVHSLIPTSFTCGPESTPCGFDGSSVLSSGAPLDAPLDFTATVNVGPGNTFWIVCLVHPNMRMKVTVVGVGEPATTQGEIDADKAQKIAKDTDSAMALDAKFEAKRTKHKTANGRTVWDVWQGVDTRWFSLLETYPKRLNIKKGQRVRWHFDQLAFETHSATFPLDEERWFVDTETFNFVCDPDGDAGPGPDTPADEQNPEFCPGGLEEVEVDFEAKSAQGTGDGVVNNQALQNSGIRGVGTENYDSYDVRFAKKSGNRPYTFFCFFHGPKMFTKVNVR